MPTETFPGPLATASSPACGERFLGSPGDRENLSVCTCVPSFSSSARAAGFLHEPQVVLPPKEMSSQGELGSCTFCGVWLLVGSSRRLAGWAWAWE